MKLSAVQLSEQYAAFLHRVWPGGPPPDIRRRPVVPRNTFHVHLTLSDGTHRRVYVTAPSREEAVKRAYGLELGSRRGDAMPLDVVKAE